MAKYKSVRTVHSNLLAFRDLLIRIIHSLNFLFVNIFPPRLESRIYSVSCNPRVKQTRTRLFIFSVLISNYQENFLPSRPRYDTFRPELYFRFSFDYFFPFSRRGERGKIMIFNHNMFALKRTTLRLNFNPWLLIFGSS